MRDLVHPYACEMIWECALSFKCVYAFDLCTKCRCNSLSHQSPISIGVLEAELIPQASRQYMLKEKQDGHVRERSCIQKNYYIVINRAGEELSSQFTVPVIPLIFWNCT